MALGANTSKWYFVGDSSSLERATKRSEDSLDRLNRTGKSAFGGLASSAGALTGLLGVGGLAYGLKSLTDAALESEKAAARMRTQFEALGIDFETHRQRVDDVIQAQSRLAALDDEDLSDSFTTILRVTGDVNRSLELNALAADIARGRQIDLASAGEIVAKVAGGNVGILSRYGISIEKGATATEALGELQRLFAGQAEAYGNSNAGAADRAAVAWENAREALGEKLLPILAKVATFVSDDLIPAVSSFAGTVDSIVDKLGGWKVAAGFILSGLFASRILAIVEAMKALAVATAAAGTASTLAAGGTLAAWAKLGTFLRFGLAGAAAVGVIEMRKPIGDFFDWMTRKLEGILGWIPGYSVKKAEEAVQAVDLRSKELMPLVGQTAGGLFYTGWHERFRLSLRTGKMELREDIAGPLSEAGDQAGDQAGEDTAKAFSLSLTAFLRVKFPTMANAALAPTWEEIRKAAEAAGLQVGGAFVSGVGQAVSGQPFPGSAPGTVTPAPGGIPSLVFPLANGSSYTRGGGPAAHASGGRGSNWQSLNAVDIMVKAGTPVLAVEDGIVEKVSGRDPAQGTVTTASGAVTFGYSITIKSKANRYFYTHLDDVVVQERQPVKAGQVIGLVAAWDRGGSHLHFAVERGNPETIYNAPGTSGFGTFPGAGYTPPSAPSTPTTSTPSTSSAPPTPQPTTSFPAIAGISDRVRNQFDDANKQPGLELVYDPKTKKWVSVKVGPDMKALKRLADHLRTKVIPGIQKRINVLKKRISRLVQKKADKVLIQTLRNKLAALVAERDEIRDLWAEIIATWKDLKEAAEEDDDTGETPSEAEPADEPTAEPADTPTQDSTADMQARLDQANRRAAINARAAALNAAGLSSIGFSIDPAGQVTATAGSGGVTVNMSMAFPPSAEQAVQIGKAVAMAASGQGFQPSTAESLGV